MATIKLEQMFLEGGFFPQARTNLTASAHKYRKQKCEEEQKTPLLLTPPQEPESTLFERGAAMLGL